MLPFETSIGPIALSATGFVALWGGLELRDRARGMAAWPSVRGRVTGGAVVANSNFDDGSPAYYPVISYQYVVGGTEYQGKRRTLVNAGVAGILRGAAQQVVARYPVGSEVTVFHDPENPGEAVLERTDPVAGPILLFALGAALVVAGPLWSKLHDLVGTRAIVAREAFQVEDPDRDRRHDSDVQSTGA